MPQETERRKPRVQTVNTMESRTVQSDVHDSDIKHIVQKFRATGGLINPRDVQLAFRDVTAFEDFHDVIQHARAAEAKFMQLPSKVREVFDHDVSKWLDAAHDPDKLEDLRPRLEKLGVLEPVVAPEPPPAAPPVVTPPVPPT